jgi:ribosomal protein S1
LDDLLDTMLDVCRQKNDRQATSIVTALLKFGSHNNEKVHGVIFNQVKGGFTVDLDVLITSCG